MVARWDAGEPEWSRDGKAIVFSSLRTEGAEYAWRDSETYAVDVGTRQVRQLTNHKGPDNGPRVSPTGKYIAFTGFDSTDATWQDSHLYVMDADGSNRRILTDTFDRSPQGILWAPDESGIYINVESDRWGNLYFVPGWIIKPPGFDAKKKYPLMLSIHGGPHSMYNGAFNFAWQEHAANGYVVLYTNPRGSTGYGSAFGNAIKNAYPGKDFNDLMAGVDTVIGRGYVDQRNLFVYGCSGGGVLTAWTVGHTDRFAAAVSMCPVIDWVSFVGTTDGQSWYNNFKKYPWEDPTEHLARSPLMYVGNVKTPTMLMTGVNDLRTPISQTEEFYEALKVRKVPTAMMRFNDEWHGTSSRPSNYLRTQLYLRSWFEKYATKDDKVAVQ